MNDAPMQKRPPVPAVCERLARLRDERGWTQAYVAKHLGIERDRYAKYERRTPLPQQFIRPAAELFGVDPMTFVVDDDMPDDGFVAQPTAVTSATELPRDLAVFGSAMGGDDGAFELNRDTVQYVERPAYLAGVKNAYGVYVQGDSMSPRFEAGWLVYVNPNMPLRRGDNVVVQIKPKAPGDPPLAYVKVFDRRANGQLFVTQFNPVKELSWPQDEVLSVHRIVGAEIV